MTFTSIQAPTVGSFVTRVEVFGSELSASSVGAPSAAVAGLSKASRLDVDWDVYFCAFGPCG